MRIRSRLRVRFIHPAAARGETLRRTGSVAALLLLSALIYCGGAKRVNLDHAPALKTFAWKSPVASTAANLTAAGWTQTDTSEGRLEFESSAESANAPEANDGAADEAGLPSAPAEASLTLFSQIDSLKVVRLVRRGSAAAIRTFAGNLAADFGVSDPAWESEPQEIDTPAGNRITRREQLFETDDAWITVRLTFTDAAESQLAEAHLSEAELQIFGKSSNMYVFISFRTL